MTDPIEQLTDNEKAMVLLLIESRDHAKLTQNLGLMRRIEKQILSMGLLV